jgi:hypothetical protein
MRIKSILLVPELFNLCHEAGKAELEQAIDTAITAFPTDELLAEIARRVK